MCSHVCGNSNSNEGRITFIIWIIIVFINLCSAGSYHYCCSLKNVPNVYYTMGYFSGVKKNEDMKFYGK